jgi:hypothetical protein
MDLLLCGVREADRQTAEEFPAGGLLFLNPCSARLLERRHLNTTIHSVSQANITFAFHKLSPEEIV